MPVNSNSVVPHYINGKFVAGQPHGQNNQSMIVQNPATLEELAVTHFASMELLEQAVSAAEKAFVDWRQVPVVDRVAPLFKLKALLDKNFDEISAIITKEHGKTLREAKGDLLRGVQMVEAAIGMTTIQMGECMDNVAREIDCQTYRRPLGIFAGINPFNFPAMVPFWFWPFAVASGNTYVIKPSERVPLTQARIFELIHECGFPPGVINMIQGGKDVVNALLTHPRIKGINFVGSTPVAQHIYRTGCFHGKRVQALGGAKNFLVLLPDAAIDRSVKAMVESCIGCAGERCLAGSVLIGVGPAYDILKKEVLKEVKNVTIGDGLNSQVNMGPVISAEAKTRILSDIETAIGEGAKMIVDGRNPSIVGGLKGHFLGVTVLDEVKPGTLMATKEIFGPVIGLMKVDSLEQAISIINSSEFANTTSIFTNNGGAAREFIQKIDPSMVGVNLGVPAPMAFFSFGGSKQSFFGDVKVHGRSSVEFFTEKHTIMQRWFKEGSSGVVNPLWHN